MSTKEAWIEETIALAEGIEAIQTPPALADRILLHIQKNKRKEPTISAPLGWAIAACLALLIGINTFSYTKLMKQESKTQSSQNAIYSTYFSYYNQY